MHLDTPYIPLKHGQLHQIDPRFAATCLMFVQHIRFIHRSHIVPNLDDFTQVGDAILRN